MGAGVMFMMYNVQHRHVADTHIHRHIHMHTHRNIDRRTDTPRRTHE